MSASFPYYEGYDHYRARYPDQAIAKILDGLPVDSLVVADIGAGTGIGSRQLADQGAQVIAIEPGVDMRRGAPTYDGVKFIEGSAENIPLETASVDLVTAFQAFHWFNFTKSLQEFRRILKPNGRLALVWNFWDQQDIASQAYTKHLYQAANTTDQYLKPEQKFSLRKQLDKFRYQLFWYGITLPYFQQLERFYFATEQLLDLEDLIGLARSQGSIPQSGEVLHQLIVKLTEFYDHYSSPQGFVRIVYKTHVYLAHRS